MPQAESVSRPCLTISISLSVTQFHISTGVYDQKDIFLLMWLAKQAVFTPTMCASAFRDSGIWPLDPSWTSAPHVRHLVAVASAASRKQVVPTPAPKREAAAGVQEELSEEEKAEKKAEDLARHTAVTDKFDHSLRKVLTTMHLAAKEEAACLPDLVSLRCRPGDQPPLFCRTKAVQDNTLLGQSKRSFARLDTLASPLNNRHLPGEICPENGQPLGALKCTDEVDALFRRPPACRRLFVAGMELTVADVLLARHPPPVDVVMDSSLTVAGGKKRKRMSIRATITEALDKDNRQRMLSFAMAAADARDRQGTSDIVDEAAAAEPTDDEPNPKRRKTDTSSSGCQYCHKHPAYCLRCLDPLTFLNLQNPDQQVMPPTMPKIGNGCETCGGSDSYCHAHIIMLLEDQEKGDKTVRVLNSLVMVKIHQLKAQGFFEEQEQRAKIKTTDARADYELEALRKLKDLGYTDSKATKVSPHICVLVRFSLPSRSNLILLLFALLLLFLLRFFFLRLFVLPYLLRSTLSLLRSTLRLLRSTLCFFSPFPPSSSAFCFISGWVLCLLYIHSGHHQRDEGLHDKANGGRPNEIQMREGKLRDPSGHGREHCGRL